MDQCKPSEALLDAAADARYLLDRGYPREQVLKLSGDRYGLDARGRHFLRRGVFGVRQAAARKNRLLNWDDLAAQDLGIDGHNLLITLESALAERPLVLADDGCVRDVAGVGRNHKPGRLTQMAADILIDSLLAAGVSAVRICLDAPLPKSGQLAAELRKKIEHAGIAGGALALAVPEKALIAHPGPVASSDSVLLDAVARPVDLAGIIIRRRWPKRSLMRLTT